ncbi:MAG TPA: hypothetical protein VK612_07700 [Pyrinomonadaceae bacterium]|nr:hypothetical protein [Pyrinomonadaceae bacterium]
MSLFATLERDTPEADKLVTLAHLAADFQEKLRSDAQKGLNVIIVGYLTSVAANDTVKEDIERGLMNKSLTSISKTLVQMGVPIDRMFIGDFVFSGSKGRKIDLFLEQQGESRHVLPGNPSDNGYRIPTVNERKPVRDAELSVNNSREVVLEITARTIKSGQRTVVPEISIKTTTGISPVEISAGVKAQLTVWKPKLESFLKKIGQGNLADKVEFSVNIIAGGAQTKEFNRQIAIEVAASLQAALTFNVTIPGTKREIPIELSYSHGAEYKGGGVSEKGEAMIKVTLFKFKSW